LTVLPFSVLLAETGTSTEATTETGDLVVNTLSNAVPLAIFLFLETTTVTESELPFSVLLAETGTSKDLESTPTGVLSETLLTNTELKEISLCQSNTNKKLNKIFL
jgi:hypothetical protein